MSATTMTSLSDLSGLLPPTRCKASFSRTSPEQITFSDGHYSVTCDRSVVAEAMAEHEDREKLPLKQLISSVQRLEGQMSSLKLELQLLESNQRLVGAVEVGVGVVVVALLFAFTR